MNFKEDLKSSAKLLAAAASDITQAVIEKNRLRANTAHLRQIIKSESEIKNQAYMELGRYFYDNLRDSAEKDQQDVCLLIDKTTERIDKATMKYVELINQINDTTLASQNSEKLKKAVYNKTASIKSSATDKVSQMKEKAVDFSAEQAKKAKEYTVTKTQQAKQAVLDIRDDLKSRVVSQDELDAMIEEHEAVIAELEAQKAAQDAVQADTADTTVTPQPHNDVEADESILDNAPSDFVPNDEESPSDFSF